MGPELLLGIVFADIALWLLVFMWGRWETGEVAFPIIGANLVVITLNVILLALIASSR